ncbi:hypothetical protein D3C73_931450 [compost metagenome]
MIKICARLFDKHKEVTLIIWIIQTKIKAIFCFKINRFVCFQLAQQILINLTIKAHTAITYFSFGVINCYHGTFDQAFILIFRFQML